MSTEIATRNPATELVRRIQADDFKAEIATLAPDGFDRKLWTARFVRIAATAIYQNPDIATADPASTLQALLSAAKDNLLPDGHESALIQFNTKDKASGNWIKKTQYLPMIAGLRKIAADYGWTLLTAVVYENDDFDYALGIDPTVNHKPARLGTPRGEAIGAYAVARHKGGAAQIEVMTRDDIEKVRAKSKNGDKGPWVDWTDRMYEKTVGKRLFAKLPLDEKDRERIERVLAADDPQDDPAEALYGTVSPTEAVLADDDFAVVEEAVLVDESVPDEPDDETRNMAEVGLLAQVPAGKLKGKTLGDLVALREKDDARGEVDAWIRKALAHKWQGGFEDVVAAVCRVYAPELIGG